MIARAMRSRKQAAVKGTQMKMSHKKSSSFSLLVSAGIEKREGPPRAGGARGPGWCSARLVVKPGFPLVH